MVVLLFKDYFNLVVYLLFVVKIRHLANLKGFAVCAQDEVCSRGVEATGTDRLSVAEDSALGHRSDCAVDLRLLYIRNDLHLGLVRILVFVLRLWRFGLRCIIAVVALVMVLWLAFLGFRLELMGL